MQSRESFPEEVSEQSLKNEWEFFQTGGLGKGGEREDTTILGKGIQCAEAEAGTAGTGLGYEFFDNTGT